MRQRADIGEVAGMYVQLKRAGASLKGLSPFGHEKTPSFYVLPEKGIFKCFSSGQGGDVFTFIQLMENMNFHESVEHLAERFHVTLEYEQGAKGAVAGQERSLRKTLEDVHEAAAVFFHEALKGHKPGVDYWTKERGFAWSTAEAFAIGYAPPADQALAEHLRRAGFGFEVLAQSGLFYLRENASQYLKCRFRGRLIIPIRDIQGKVVAFSGRQTATTPHDDPAREAKYINSPETPIFKKGQLLFGLDQARKALKDSEWPFILVEGPLDVMRLWEAGVKTALAPQGTGMTVHQVALIKRYAQELVLFLDGDLAGQKAALRLLPLFFQKGIEPKVLTLDSGEDPDVWVRAHGLEEFKKKLFSAKSPIAFAWEALHSIDTPKTPAQRQTALNVLYEVIASVESAVQTQDYLYELGRVASIGIDSLTSDYQLFLSKNNASRLKPRPEAAFYKKSSSQEKTSELLTNPEFELLFIFLHREDLFKKIAPVLDPDWINAERVWGALLKKILLAYREGLWEGLKSLEAIGLQEDEKQRVYTLLAQESSFKHLETTAEDTMRALFIRQCKSGLEALNASVARLDPSDAEGLRALHEKRVVLRNYIKTPPQFVA